jgi:hypothetical protein
LILRKFEMLGQVVDQDSHGGHNSAIGGEHEMDRDFVGVPVGQNANQAFCADIIVSHFSRQQSYSQPGSGSAQQYAEVARSQDWIE